jgi:hypothetical protein
MDDPDRAAILARRRRFIALALTGIAVTACKTKSGPQPCLNVGYPENQPTGETDTDGPAVTEGPAADTDGIEPSADPPTDEPEKTEPAG